MQDVADEAITAGSRPRVGSDPRELPRRSGHCRRPRGGRTRSPRRCAPPTPRRSCSVRRPPAPTPASPTGSPRPSRPSPKNFVHSHPDHAAHPCSELDLVQLQAEVVHVFESRRCATLDLVDWSDARSRDLRHSAASAQLSVARGCATVLDSVGAVPPVQTPERTPRTPEHRHAGRSALSGHGRNLVRRLLPARRPT